MSGCGDGCNFENGKQVVNKLRMMGYNKNPLPQPYTIKCVECGMDIQIKTFEDACPHCCMVYGITPCHSHSAEFLMPAGVNYNP